MFPELVQTDAEGYKSLDYVSMTAVLVQAMNEQQVIIEELRKENKHLQSSFSKLEAKVDVQLVKLEKVKL